MVLSGGEIAHNKANQPDILFASALKMTGYLQRYALNQKLVLL